MSDKYADAFAFLEHMGKTLEDDANAALEILRMHYDPRGSTLALRYGSIGRDVRRMAKLLHEAFLYETRDKPEPTPERELVHNPGTDSVTLSREQAGQFIDPIPRAGGEGERGEQLYLLPMRT